MDEHWKLFVLILKGLAEQKGISHSQIAKECGMHKSNVTRVFSLKYCPSLKIFMLISRAIGVNFFFEDKEGNTDLNLAMEKAMETLGRRPGNLPKN